MHIVSIEVIHEIIKNIDSVNNGPYIPLLQISQVSIIGLYYKRFVEGISSIAYPFSKLTQKKVKGQWSDDHEIIFVELKSRLTIAFVLTLP